MHRALQVAEIRSQICLRCSRQTLSSLARTATIFHDAAQNVLWKEIEMVQFIRALPDDVVKVNPGRFQRHTHSKVTFLKPLRPEILHRLMSLSRRVKAVRFGQFSTKIPPALWDALLGTADRLFLFPHLESLEVDIRPTALLSSWAILRYCLSPELQSLDMHLDVPSNLGQQSWLSQLSTSCPKLRKLSLRWDVHEPIDQDTIDALSSAICGWRDLEVLFVPSLNAEALTHVSTLPSLRTLTTCTPLPLNTFTAPSSSTCRKLFPSLSVLSFHASFAVWSQMLQATLASPIVSLTMVLSTPFFEPHWKTLLSLIGSGLRNHKHFRNLHLHEVDSDHPRPPCTVSALQPLLSLRTLTTLELKPSSGFHLTDQDIGRLAAAWPNLQSIELSSNPHAGVERSRPTLDGLSRLVELCPSLWNIEIPLDASDAHVSDEKPANGISNEKIDSLNIGMAHITSATDVALTLSSLFPSLESIYCDERARQDLREKWNEVERLVPMFARARRQEVGFRRA